jgi:hypothetical protein
MSLMLSVCRQQNRGTFESKLRSMTSLSFTLQALIEASPSRIQVHRYSYLQSTARYTFADRMTLLSQYVDKTGFAKVSQEF